MARLSNKIAVVTGGASGIGLACVRRFAAEGAQVVGLDLGAPGAQALASLEGLQPAPQFLGLDVRDEAQVQQRMEEVRQRFGRSTCWSTLPAWPAAAASPTAAARSGGGCWRST